MPDKFNHTDPAFTDHSWSEMKKLLDREMPVRPLPFWRRKGLLWLLLLLIPFGVVLGYYHWESRKAEPQPPVLTPVAQKPVANAPASIKCGDVAMEMPAVATENLAGNKSPVRVISQKTEAQVVVVEEQQAIAIPPAQAAFFPVTEFIPTSLFSPQHASGLTLRAPSPFASRTPDIRLQAPHFILEAGPFAASGFRSAGGSAALVAGKSFGQSAWGIQTGLGYSFYENPFPARSLTQGVRGGDFSDLPEESLGTDPMQFDTNAAIEAFASSADSTISRLHYLDIPVLVTYQAGQRWQFQAGASMSLLLASRTETGEDAGFGLLGAARLDAFDSAPISNTAEAAAALSELRIINPSLQLGLAYFPAPKWTVGLQANFGLRDLMSEWPGSQRLDKVQVKVGWRF